MSPPLFALILVLQGTCLAMVVMQWQDDALNTLRQIFLLSCSLVLLTCSIFSSHSFL